MVFVCAGMRRSASTLSYQIVNELIGDADNVLRRVELVEPHHFHSPAWFTVKTHAFIRDWIPYLDSKLAKVLVTYRDPRDCQLSAIQTRDRRGQTVYANSPIVDSCRATKKWLDLAYDTQGARYEEFKDNIPLLVMRIIGMTGVQAHVYDVAEKFSWEANLERSQTRGSTDRDFFFPSHMGDGEIGKWKDLLDDVQTKTLQDKIGQKWFEQFGYEWIEWPEDILCDP